MEKSFQIKSFVVDEFFISFLSYLGLGYIGRRFSTQTILVRSYNTGSIKSYPPPPSDIFQFISFTRQNFNYPRASSAEQIQTI